MRMIAMQQCVSNSFPLPHEVFELGLSRGALLMYIYLVYHKSMHRNYEFTEEDVRQRRADSVRNVKRTNGRLSFEEKIYPEDRVGSEWRD